MFSQRFLAVIALMGLAATPVLAQTTAPATPIRPAVTAPAMKAAPAPAATAPMTNPMTKQTNLNTATAAELDALPEVGKSRTKAILAERSKGRFKDWADFDKRMTGTSVNSGVKAKIKTLVTF